MAAAAGADLLGLGEHCSVPHCGQLDFLPFQCDCCHKTYCLEHRSYATHACPAAGSRSSEVIVCPLCAKGVKLLGRDANIAFEEHQREGTCDASNWRRVHARPRCPVKGCREKLTTINTFSCRKCSQRVCLKHRDVEDHACSAAIAAAAQARKAAPSAAATAASNFFSQLTGALTPSTSGAGAGTGSRPGSAPPPSAAKPTGSAATTAAAAAAGVQQYRQLLGAAHGTSVSSSGAYDNTLRGTAERRRQQQHSGSGTASPQVEVVNPMHQGAPTQPSSLPEVCPHCTARFATVERLVQHVEDFHPPDQQHAPHATTAAVARVAPPPRPPPAPAPAPTTNGGAAYGRRLGSAADEASPYRCPHCERGFSDPAVLVGHAETCPARGGAVAAAGGGAAGGKSDCSMM